ncbi:MAG: bacteriohopanetetrol glucosamine biosynthesis glycosyltransferase HpnI [Candidatus Eremiobacteraeota bacterium]|nr:bacteriohopanetetrol glucosamine biosynthesis glycosyltransferase HpnI [Candidatus Eremiobacteraeota bacterium]
MRFSPATCAALAGLAYLGVAVACLRRFGARRAEHGTATPSVSILKPLRGAEEGLYENLVSFCEQAYPDFRLYLSVRDPGDPAAQVARSVVARFGDRCELAVGAAATDAPNPKIANLSAVAARARGEIVVIADADMRVGPDYLRAIVAPFERREVGLVTCLYRGRPAGGLASQLGAMFINEQFAPSVLVAGALEPLRYGFGATLAVRRETLDAIGGLNALGAHIADDHRLGQLTSERGWKVVLARYVVENVVAERNLASLWARELRWSRTIRSVRPWGHAFSFVTFGLPLALLAAAPARDRSARGFLVGSALALRFALRREAGRALGAAPAGSPMLVPLRDALSLATWVASFFGRRVRWRGETLEL